MQRDNGLAAPASLTRIDANTVEAQYERGFKTIATSKRVVSPADSQAPSAPHLKKILPLVLRMRTSLPPPFTFWWEEWALAPSLGTSISSFSLECWPVRVAASIS